MCLSWIPLRSAVLNEIVFKTGYRKECSFENHVVQVRLVALLKQRLLGLTELEGFVLSFGRADPPVLNAIIIFLAGVHGPFHKSVSKSQGVRSTKVRIPGESGV